MQTRQPCWTIWVKSEQNNHLKPFLMSLTLHLLMICKVYLSTFCKSRRVHLLGCGLSYMDMVSLLLRFIRATREGAWIDHLSAVAGVTPWMFSYDHTNYSRYLPVIAAAPTDLSTVYVMCKRSVAVAHKLNKKMF